MTDITVPKLNNNDLTYVLVEWLVGSGEPVTADTAVAVVESTKAAEELVAGAPGVLHRMTEPGTECAVGTVIGKVFPAAEDRRGFLAASMPASAPVTDAAPAGCVITEPARALAVELGMDLTRLESLGVAVVRRADVLRLADGSANQVLTLPRSQVGVADAVTRSHARIPAAFTVVRVDVGAALTYARAATRRLRALVGLPELVLEALGAIAADFPVCFAAPDGPATMRRATGVHVAVTVDVGAGLYLPVVRDCDRLSLGEIAAELMRLRGLAMRARFRVADLAGGTIMLSLNTDPDVVLAQPIVAPGTVCAVSLGGVHGEAVLDAGTGTVRERATVMLGAAYDHRYVNGGDAVRFLKAIKARLERPRERPAGEENT
ncbi:2-oxo acid dehydrogenase subunit E2 [Actinoplanes sp. NPDC026619]|uniref:2-oxo acid dehydrogenase subunit E2 n=1 Tax=Actinoplanes sp. NPDC026619 TaxID=3155798 RepID=UPI0033CAA7D8